MAALAVLENQRSNKFSADHLRLSNAEHHRCSASIFAYLHAGDRLNLLNITPMLAYFTMAPEGERELARHEKLSAWWEKVQSRVSILATDPGLPEP